MSNPVALTAIAREQRAKAADLDAIRDLIRVAQWEGWKGHNSFVLLRAQAAFERLVEDAA